MRSVRSLYRVLIRLFVVIPMVMVLPLDGQDTFDANTKTHLYRKVNMSVMLGFSKLGMESDIENKMEERGLNWNFRNWLFSGTTDYPFSSREAVYDMELTYHYNRDRGVGLNYALVNDVHIFGRGGFDSIVGHSIALHIEQNAISLPYIFSFYRQRLNLFVGPAYSNLKVSQTYAGINLHSVYRSAWGAYLGIAANVIHKKSWFIQIKANYRILSNITVGPYQSRIFSYNGEDYFVEIDECTVNPSVLNIGIGLGLRLGAFSDD